MLHQYIRATASSLLLMSCYWLYIHTGKLDGNKEPLLLDNDLCIMVHQRCPERRPTAVKDSGLWFLTRWKREESLWPLFILLGMHAYSMNQTLRSMVFARSILDCSFTFHIYTRPSSVYPLLLLHFQGNRRSKKKKATALGTSQDCTVQVPVWLWVPCIGCGGVLSTFAGYTFGQLIWKGGETLTLHCLELALYICVRTTRMLVMRVARERAICHVQALGSQL